VFFLFITFCLQTLFRVQQCSDELLTRVYYSVANRVDTLFNTFPHFLDGFLKRKENVYQTFSTNCEKLITFIRFRHGQYLYFEI